MDDIPIALDGFLVNPAEPGSHDGSACWRLNCSATTDHLVEEAVIPCTTADPQIADALLTDRHPGDLLRVTGALTLPDAAAGIIQLHVRTVSVLSEAPHMDHQDNEDDAENTQRGQAITALADALTNLSGATPGPEPKIRVYLGPVGPHGSGLEQRRNIDLTPALAFQLAGAAKELTTETETEPGCTTVDPETAAELTQLFDRINLLDLTNAVLKNTRPENKPDVLEAMDDMLPDVPGFGDIDP
ncbi:hypothetical protein [Streptomyces sp. N35]|uniref:hypothetical protein n=1 Tax=Streptomyces sp. N35 TaxID=2795730 RepID=UPI0018F44C7F|nr:hypothetical protein [Streptomyces sp. N35]